MFLCKNEMNRAVLYLKYWPTQPATWGEDMLVPFSSWVPRSVKLDTEVMAAPGAHTVTPLSPSIVGPREDHVKGIPGSFWRNEYSACIISGETYAPTPVKILTNCWTHKNLLGPTEKIFYSSQRRHSDVL